MDTDLLTRHREVMRAAHRADEAALLNRLRRDNPFDADLRAAATARAIDLINAIRARKNPGLMEVFLAEYGLSTNEGVALMCLAEALLRVPDAETMDALIEDKIAPSAWGEHLGKASSPLVNASTWALMLTGRVLREDEDEHGGRASMAAVLHAAVKRLGEPVIRAAVQRAMKELGQQFVLGQTIDEAVKRGQKKAVLGYSFSYDMLGEAALTAKDAETYFEAYRNAIARLASECTAQDIRKNPGISIKLSALHPRYELGQRDRVMAELVPRVMALTRQAAQAGMGLNIDAEEADRLDLSLDIIEAVLRDSALAGWDGFGIVVQAYGRRAAGIIDWLHALAEELDRRFMVRLVKGAYWDTEIKRAQIDGVEDFPVFTDKAATDVSYLCCAKKLLGMTDRLYPQFATHNAHSIAAIQEVARRDHVAPEKYEFQRLHGMGEALHDLVLKDGTARSRIYAPVGAHRDLLAYLVRRLLENGANSSFVNQIVDESVPAEVIASDPFDALDRGARSNAALIRRPPELYGHERRNAKGWDLKNLTDRRAIETARAGFRDTVWQAAPLLADGAPPTAPPTAPAKPVMSPANPDDKVGLVVEATVEDAARALDLARPWGDVAVRERAGVLRRAADLYEAHFGEFFALLAREAGKTPDDAIAELREAVDFLLYYAGEAERYPEHNPRGLIACISPWNFPLAIFTGQIAAALAAGNGVLAKPAETTCLTAQLAVSLLHEAGVPRHALQLLPGPGPVIGAAMTADPRIKGVCFTGSTATAQRINRTVADNGDPGALFIAETGGINAMIVDSTALPEQAVRDIVTSAFRSAGQRCSALRMLYLQKDIAGPFMEMLEGAMAELVLGDPWSFATDIGPVIDQRARDDITSYIDAAEADGRLMKRFDVPLRGYFVSPALIRVNGISDIEREVFGPVLHVATYKAEEIDAVIDAVNASGYGLTFGMHSRIDDRVHQVTRRLNVGNIYINRNQIGAIVGSQPFGGEGLSGTGPKAGGPHYVPRFFVPPSAGVAFENDLAGSHASLSAVQAALDEVSDDRDAHAERIALPGPTGESNVLSMHPRGTVLCLGPGLAAAQAQAQTARDAGCPALVVAPGASSSEGIDGMLDLNDLTAMTGVEAVALWCDGTMARMARQALAAREGKLIPLITAGDLSAYCRYERHICIDTTAAGGNASLLAATA